MYTPKHFELTNTSEAVAFMQRYSFATLINVIDDLPVATHLPFVITHNGDQVILSSHLAKPNVQAQHLLAGTSLVIFTEPHAYIAPKHYETTLLSMRMVQRH
jgi:transcriptional regulator